MAMTPSTPSAPSTSSPLTAPSGTAERIASTLRRQITAGEHPPGTRLSEEMLGARLKISRNTLREAFRLLSHDGLLMHELHRGVFVREPNEADLIDVFHLRRVLECGTVRSLTRLGAERLAPLTDAVVAGQNAAEQGTWHEVGTANIDFHQALVALGGSRRADDTIRRLLAEVRLFFHVFPDPRELFEPFLKRNAMLVDMLERGDMTAAADALETYLRDSENHVLRAYRRQPADAGSRR